MNGSEVTAEEKQALARQTRQMALDSARRGEQDFFDAAAEEIAARVSMKEGSKRYKALLDEALDLHLRKNQGYSAGNLDAFSNFRLAEDLGLPAWKGSLVRAGDKWARIVSLTQNPDNDRVNEAMRDTLLDLSAYCMITVLLREEAGLDPTSKDSGPEAC